MSLIRNIFLITRLNFKKWRTNYRVWFIAVYLLVLTFYCNQNIGTACSITNIKISPWLFPFMFTRTVTIILFTLPLLILFCDAPFLDDTQPYIVVRSKRTVWALGQITYVVISSFIYAAYLFFVSIATNLHNMEFTSDWGNFMNSSLANTYLSENPRGYFFVDDFITRNFTPLQGIWFTFLYLWLAGILLGLLMFCLNSLSNSRIVGGVCAAFVIMMGYLGGGRNYSEFAWFSPVSWISRMSIDVGGQLEGYPNFIYTVIVYAVLFAVLLGVIFATNRKRTIEVLPPV